MLVYIQADYIIYFILPVQYRDRKFKATNEYYVPQVGTVSLSISLPFHRG